MEAYQRLEVEIADWAGYTPEQVVVCSSGTAALHIALESLRLPLGSEVITGDFNMVAVPRAIKLAGLIPLFVDCDERLLIDPDKVEEAVEDAYDGVGNSNWKPGRRISAVIATHIYGRRCDMFRLRKATESLNIVLIEDLAEAHGVEPYVSDAACWSFYKNKIIAGEEGGAVAFRDYGNEGIAERARSLRSLGFTPEHDFNHIPRGHNYRLANCLAEKVLESLEMYNSNMTRRRALEAEYDFHCPEDWEMPERDAQWVFDVRIPGLTREKQTDIVKALNAERIAARHSFLPMSSLEEFKTCRRVGGENARKASNEVFYLPLGPETAPDTPSRAFATIRRLLS